MINLKELNYFPLEKNKKNNIYFYLPYFIFLAWIFFSIISIFFINFKLMLNSFVLFSIFIRLSIAGSGLYFFYNIFINLKKDKKFFNYFKAYVGYGIVFTFVFYSLPRMVGEFESAITFTQAVLDYLFVIFITIFPLSLYLFLRSDQTRLILNIYNDKDLELEKRIKKDKNLKKKEHERLKKERTFLENLWYEWIDVIIQAIVIVLIIQQFFFQLYQIPSESMVPTFVKTDRVFVNKLIYGPHLPLTDWKIMPLKRPKVGDIVVFINPETDTPGSDMRYKNVFTRIFHPFIFMLSFGTVDIDKKEDGNPKERFIVKRFIAKENEKICLVNDKVYKKSPNDNWKLMSEIEKQKEYGKPDLYYKDNPYMDSQNMSPYIRSLLNEAENLISKKSVEDLEKELILSKQKFLSVINSQNYSYLKSLIDQVIKKNEETRNKNFQNLIKATGINLNFNNKNFLQFVLGKEMLTETEIKEQEKELEIQFSKSLFNVYLLLLTDFKESLDNNFSTINTRIIMNTDDSPYKKYMKTLNAVYKINMMNFITEILLTQIDKIPEDRYFKNNTGALHNLFLLSLYIDGFESLVYYDPYKSLVKDTVNTFSLRNFRDYPEEKNSYISKNEYFMLGDNRYNSLDSRLGYISRIVSLDDSDNGPFSKKVKVNWLPHTIKEKYILGKAEFIYWPINRISILK